MSAADPRYLTTRELADLLRIKERKVYELAASGEVPCSRAMGKLLFPREQVYAWLASNSSGPAATHTNPRPNVMLGSHDPLLEWAMRESRCGMAGYFDSSLDGLEKFAAGEGIAAGVHVTDATAKGWNVEAVKRALPGESLVLVEWARRTRGLMTAADDGHTFTSLKDIAGHKTVARQAEAGSQVLLLQLLKQVNLGEAELQWIGPARSESDAAVMVQEGKADVAFGLASVASQHRLNFVAVATERFDLVVDRKAWFDKSFQMLISFCRSDTFAERAAALTGYDITGQFTVHYNAP